MRNLFVSCLSALTIIGLATGIGCGDRTLRPLNPCTVSGVTESINVNAVDSVDLLLVIDDSSSMTEEQAKLKAEIPDLVRILVSGDYNNNGMVDPEDFDPVRDLNVGFVSTDMGNAGTESTCGASGNLGKDGVLLGSMKVLNFQQGGNQAAFIAAVESGVDAMGTMGCGIEQQLEAIAKAVAPQSQTIFRNTSGGHADGANNGFLRPNAVLAIIVVSDEEDCSTHDAYPFNVAGAAGMTPPRQNFLCYECALGSAANCKLNAVQRYVDSIIDTSGKPAKQIVFGGIIGVPEENGTSKYNSTDYGAILSDPDMDYVEISQTDYSSTYTNSPRTPTGQQARPVCGPNAGAETVATPGRRYVELAQGLAQKGAAAAVHSICSANYQAAVVDIVDKIADALGGLCLERELNPGASGEVPCSVIVTMPEGTTCASLDGVEDTPVDTVEGREVCRGIQLIPSGNTPPSGNGWYYDTFSAGLDDCPAGRKQRISFANQDSIAPLGSDLDLECLQPVLGANGTVTVGTACAGNAAVCADAPSTLAGSGEASTFPYELKCNGATNTCEAPCDLGNGDADCPGGHVCFAPEGLMLDSTPAGISQVGICVNPTCVS